MMPIKIQCARGQRYSFEVEPADGRMPSSIACGADGTVAANEIIAQNMPVPSVKGSDLTIDTMLVGG
jgi:hypothetical protein